MRATGCNPCWYSPFAGGPTPISVGGVLGYVLLMGMSIVVSTQTNIVMIINTRVVLGKLVV